MKGRGVCPSNEVEGVNESEKGRVRARKTSPLYKRGELNPRRWQFGNTGVTGGSKKVLKKTKKNQRRGKKCS